MGKCVGWVKQEKKKKSGRACRPLEEREDWINYLRLVSVKTLSIIRSIGMKWEVGHCNKTAASHHQ